MGGKLLAILAGVALCLAGLAYIGHVRTENAALRKDKARLEESIALLTENAKLAMHLARKQSDARSAIEPKLEKLKHDLLTRKYPKLPDVCDHALDPVRDALEWVQRNASGGCTASAGCPMQGPTGVVRGQSQNNDRP